jgi:acyl carrier protein
MNMVTQCFVRAFGVDSSSVTDDMAYQSIPQWDSVGHMALVAELENAFDVTFDTDDIIGMSSVAKAKGILTRLGADVNAPAT